MAKRITQVERLARRLRQWDAEDTAKTNGHRYPYTVLETWGRCGWTLKEAYRAEARRILRFLRSQGITERPDQHGSGQAGEPEPAELGPGRPPTERGHQTEHYREQQ